MLLFRADVFLLHLPVQGPSPRLMCVRLFHQAPHGVQAGRVLLLVVITRQVQPGEYLVPLVDGAVEVLQSSPQPVNHLTSASARAFVTGPTVMPQGSGFPGEAMKGRPGRKQGRHRDRFLGKAGPLPDGLIERYPQGTQGGEGRKSRRKSSISLLWWWL
jgi:hypothetical protein